MTGSANDRFLMRSVRSCMPNSINPQLDPQMLINRRIEKHEGRIKNKNKTNKVIYPVGARVRLQDAKTKLFDTNGTILEPRWTDSQEIVSYIIRTDKGLLTTRHRKYIRQLEPENDPTITNKNIFTNLGTPAADPGILKSVKMEQKATDPAEDITEKVGKRRSGRIKDLASLKGISKIKVRKVIVSPKSVTMGQTCSSQLKEAQAKNKKLEGRIRLFEKGITDKSIHASQTNFC